MSNYEQKPGEFTLFKNSNKKTDKSPDVSGSGKNLDGQKISVSGWLARKDGELIKDKNGNTIINCRIQLDPDKAEPKKADPVEESEPDDLPF